MTASASRCARCGRVVPDDEGFRLSGPGEGRRAAFCRLEHVVAWVIRGATWDPGGALVEPPPGSRAAECSQCARELEDPPPLLLVSHRQADRIPDAFCSLEHLRAWALAGGRWRR